MWGGLQILLAKGMMQMKPIHVLSIIYLALRIAKAILELAVVYF